MGTQLKVIFPPRYMIVITIHRNSPKISKVIHILESLFLYDTKSHEILNFLAPNFGLLIHKIYMT